MQQCAAEVFARDYREALFQRWHDVGRAYCFGGIVAVHVVDGRPLDRMLDTGIANHVSQALGYQRQQAAGMPQLRLGPLELVWPNELVANKQSPWQQRAPYLLKVMFQSLNVMQGLGGEHSAVLMLGEFQRVEVGDLVIDAFGLTGFLRQLARKLHRIRSYIVGVEPIRDLQLQPMSLQSAATAAQTQRTRHWLWEMCTCHRFQPAHFGATGN